MNSIQDILKKVEPKKESKIQKWQDDALDVIKFLVDGKQYTSQIFKCFKLRPNDAKIAYLECKELNKPFSRYFLKIWSNLRKN